MGDKAARGFSYALAQFGGAKIITLLGQYVLSWLLEEEDYGYIGLTFAVVAFGSLISAAGLRDVLIRRWRDFDHWATPAFWMSATLGAVSMLLTWSTAPLAAWFFRDPRLTPLILILACQIFFGSLALIPDARLTIDLRFKLLAAVNFGTSTIVMSLSVLFAALGYGAYSFILPWPIAAAVRAAILWKASRPRIRFRPHLRLWKQMAGDSVLLAVGAFFVMISTQFDYVILGRMYEDKGVIGRYFLGFNLSTQTLQFLGLNLGAILLPSLAKMQDDPRRQLSAFLRAAQALVVLTVPLCLLQATLADPLIKLAFREEWRQAIPIVAILSAGWVLLAVNWPALNAMKAQGRFATYVGYLTFAAGVFLLAVYIGARIGAEVGAAAGVAIQSSICGPLSVYVAIRPIGGTWRDTRNIFLSPLLAGVIAFGVAALLAWLIPRSLLQHLIRAVVIISVGGTLYIAAIRQVARPASTEIWMRMRAMFQRK